MFWPCYQSYCEFRDKTETVQTHMMRLIMSRLIWVCTVCKFNYFGFWALRVNLKIFKLPQYINVQLYTTFTETNI